MIIITRIEFKETEQSIHQILDSTDYQNDALTLAANQDLRPTSIRTTEIVKGTRFIFPNGEELVIGASKQAKKIVGVLFEAIETYKHLREEEVKATEEARNSSNYYQAQTKQLLGQLEAINQMTLFQRLKAVFTGVYS